MTIKFATSGKVYDLGAEADEVLLALKIMGKENLLQHLLTRMYEIGFNEAVKLCNAKTNELREEQQ